MAEVRAAEAAGYDSVWVNESYGSDAVSMLGWLAPQTTTIGLGAAIMPAPARPPAAAAMAGVTLDYLSGGRFIFGFGPSGPQVSEGWYGVPYVKPWGRVREYVEIVREIVARREARWSTAARTTRCPVTGAGTTGSGQGAEAQLPPAPQRDPGLPGRDRAQVGRALRRARRRLDSRLPRPGELGGRCGASTSRPASSGAVASASALAVSPTVQVAIDGDLETARAGARMRMTLYLGGMGSKKFNFYGELARRMGFGAVADEVQELFLAGEKEKAFNAVPDELLDRVCLLGDERAVGEGLARFADGRRRPGDRDPRPRRPGRAPAHDRRA